MQEQDLNPNRLLKENLFLKDNLSGYKRFIILLSELCISMESILDADKLIVFFVNKLAEIFKVNRVSFMLLDESKGELFVQAAQGLNTAAEEARLKLGEGFGGQVAREGRPMLVKNVETEFPYLSKNRLSRYLTKSFVILPIKIKERVTGILSLTDKKDQGIFTDEDLHILTLMARSIALYIENIKLSEKNKSLSSFDPLTELFGHRYFQEQLIEEVNRAERYQRPLSLIMLDIDNFSNYNQDFGYASGDSVLKQLAKIMKENTRNIDFASRYGPEEFTVLLPETSLKEAVAVAERIKEKIAHSIFTQDRTSSLGMSRITVSIGVVQHKVGLSNEELIHRGTSALQEAKQKGKNCVCVYK